MKSSFLQTSKRLETFVSALITISSDDEVLYPGHMTLSELGQASSNDIIFCDPKDKNWKARKPNGLKSFFRVARIAATVRDKITVARLLHALLEQKCCPVKIKMLSDQKRIQ